MRMRTQIRGPTARRTRLFRSMGYRQPSCGISGDVALERGLEGRFRDLRDDAAEHYPDLYAGGQWSTFKAGWIGFTSMPGDDIARRALELEVGADLVIGLPHSESGLMEVAAQVVDAVNVSSPESYATWDTRNGEITVYVTGDLTPQVEEAIERAHGDIPVSVTEHAPVGEVPEDGNLRSLSYDVYLG